MVWEVKKKVFKLILCIRGDVPVQTANPGRGGSGGKCRGGHDLL